MTHQPELLPDQPSPTQAVRDAERAEYLERLREKLKASEFRAIEGFPIGEDEDILALSDPPYYTACPNPFLPEIIERWQAERAQLREELGLPDDSADNGDGGEPVYHREPFAADVSEGKNDPIYNAHSYHTKVPHKAVMRYILHYTDPGDVVFDGFCGTGMTGVAAQLCGDKNMVESLGYRVQDDGTILDDQGRLVSYLGARKAVLVELSPAATFIAHNYNNPVDAIAFEQEAERVLVEVEEECGWMYETLHSDNTTKAKINYVIWSDVFSCPQCSGDIVYWDEAVDDESGAIAKEFPCPSCDTVVSKQNLQRQWEVYYDPIQQNTRRRLKRVPVLINYSVGRSRYEKRPDQNDLDLIRRIEESNPRDWFPTDKMMFSDGRWGDQWREGYHADVTHVHHFYGRRNLDVLASYYARATRSKLARPLLFALTAVVKYSGWMNRISPSSTMGLFRTRSGTLYIGSITGEINLIDSLRSKSTRTLKSLFSKVPEDDVLVSTSSATQVSLPDNSVDYIFVDPPFGSNLAYSELNFLWESWLRVFTNTQPEAIISKHQQKGLADYQRLMTGCFEEMFRILKPGRWMTVEFHNSKNSVWNAIQEAVLRAGFVVADVRTLDKVGRSFNVINAASAVKQDLIISAYKPRTGFERRFLEQAGSEEGAWAFVRQHLEQLPIAVEQDGALEVVAERQAYLLYDRMVAFHIQRGFSVPMGAAEFYAGLKQRFPERDGMYFLPHQVAEYDRRRLRAERVEQLALFVTDEKSAIQWLRQELDPATGSGPQTYQDIQPKFLRELHKARHEALPELSDMLVQNFLKDEQDRWYVPDPARQEDLEKLRERSLLREFQEYAQGKGRLRVFRTEAVRAGFKHAWHERDYRLIIKVAERLPESVLQEDASLLMYYDNALMRAESEPEQERLL